MLGKIRRQFVVPCSVQVKLPRGLSRASLVTTFGPHQAQNRAYQTDLYFMIRCDREIMKNSLENSRK